LGNRKLALYSVTVIVYYISKPIMGQTF